MAAKRKIVFLDSSFAQLDRFEKVLNPLGAEVREVRIGTEAAAVPHVGDAFGIVTDYLPVGETILAAAPQLKIVVRQAIGIDDLDIRAASRRGVMVCHVPDYCLDEVAEHTVALLLALQRKIILGHQRMVQGDCDYHSLCPIHRLTGARLGFVGFGRIARLVAAKLAGFNLKVRFFDPFIPEAQVNGACNAPLEEVLATSDVLLVHAPETEQTHHLLDRKTLSRMKPGALLVNTSRGGLIDTPALEALLDQGHLAGAALDVVEGERTLCPTSPLCRMENVILTPHCGWYSEEALEQLESDVAQALARALRGERPRHLLNPDFGKS
jgi:D-3-phosphoglycerate dehydrogenase / 2-oxoglutarate reductase